MFTHTTASIEGLTTIRAFKAQQKLIQEYDQHQNINTSAFFLFAVTSRKLSFVQVLKFLLQVKISGGFAFYVDFISSLYITTIVYSFLVLGTSKSLSNWNY